MPRSITEVLLDCYHEGDAKPFVRFKNHADHMHRSDAPTVKTGGAAKMTILDNKIRAAEAKKAK